MAKEHNKTFISIIFALFLFNETQGKENPCEFFGVRRSSWRSQEFSKFVHGSSTGSNLGSVTDFAHRWFSWPLLVFPV
jgi:hypothetical protein